MTSAVVVNSLIPRAEALDPWASHWEPAVSSSKPRRRGRGITLGAGSFRAGGTPLCKSPVLQLGERRSAVVVISQRLADARPFIIALPRRPAHSRLGLRGHQ